MLHRSATKSVIGEGGMPCSPCGDLKSLNETQSGPAPKCDGLTGSCEKGRTETVKLITPYDDECPLKNAPADFRQMNAQLAAR
eukprot:scaffold157731_cov18-Tisochrysis_lutea.AAC.1